MTDIIVVAIALGGVAGAGYALGAKASVGAATATVIEREYLTKVVWSPACGPEVAGKAVDEAAVRALEADIGTATNGDGSQTRRGGEAYTDAGRGRRWDPYERARREADSRWYRSMFREPGKSRGI